MAIRIRAVQTADEAQSVFRLRYEVYVEELERTQRYADHSRRTIEEPLDRSGLLFAAFEGARVVGTLRINYPRSCDLSDYVALYQMQRVGGAHPLHTSIVTKLLVAADKRNTTLGYRLSLAAYQQGLRDNILFNFIDVYPARVPFFERLGYRVHSPVTLHPEYGAVVVMKMDMRDAQHFHSIGSPFLRFLQRARAAA